MWDKYKYIHNNASDCMKKSRNDSLYKVGKYEQFTYSINSKKANKLPKAKNFYLELACRPWCNAVAYHFCANYQPKMTSQWVHGLSHRIKDDCSNKTSAGCWVKCNVPSSHFLISSFPHSPFLISHFLVPTFRVTPRLYTLVWPARLSFLQSTTYSVEGCFGRGVASETKAVLF